MSERPCVLKATIDEECTGTRVLIVVKAHCVEMIGICDFPGAMMFSRRLKWRQLDHQCLFIQKASRATNMPRSYDQPCLQELTGKHWASVLAILASAGGGFSQTPQF